MSLTNISLFHHQTDSQYIHCYNDHQAIFHLTWNLIFNKLLQFFWLVSVHIWINIVSNYPKIPFNHSLVSIVQDHKHFSHATVTFLYLLSFPVISLCLGHVSGYLLATVLPSVTVQLAYCLMLNYPHCGKKSSFKARIFCIAICVYWISSFHCLTQRGVWCHLLYILPQGSWKDIWSKFTNACRKGYIQGMASEQFEELLWGIHLAIKYM